MENTLKVGDKIKFTEDKKPYTVKASKVQFAICTYPAFGKVVYCIIDFERGIRAPDDYVMGSLGYKTPEDIEEAMRRLFLPDSDGIKLELSERRKCKLNIEWVK